jgi:predicted nucleic acid-binding protein
VRSWDLGAGESAVLPETLNRPNAVTVLDDALARKCAQTLRIETFRTLAIILLAKQRGTITLAQPLFDQMRANGMFLSGAVINRALTLVGE